MNKPAQTHYLSRALPQWGKKSRAYWAVAPKQNALLFVHGFGGSATGTWSDFPRLLQNRPDCDGVDLLFYGYDSLYRRAYINSAKLLSLLDALFLTPVKVIDATLPPAAARGAGFAYERITIVAHSLGAVVSRQALIDAVRTRSWANRVSLALFAPAHMGASLLPLVCSAMGAFKILPVEAAAKALFPSLLDLEESSQTIQDLRSQTEEALRMGGGSSLIARRVLLADDERVVSPNRFVQDPPGLVIAGTNHMNVCKPREDSSDPLRQVVELLS